MGNIFRADMTSFVYTNNKNKDILILGDGPTQKLDDTTLTTEAKYPINFAQLRKRFVLILQHNGSNSFLFGNARKIYEFKANNSAIKNFTLCLGNIFKNVTVNNMKRTELKGSVKFFIVAKIFFDFYIFKFL